MILHLYFARRFLSRFVGIAAAFGALIFVVDLVDQLRRFDAVEVGFGAILHLTLLSLPQSLGAILPLLVVLTSIALFLGLARSSELVVTRAAGRSALRSLIGPVLMACALGVAAIAILNPITAATITRYEAVADELRSAQRSILAIGRQGVWLRQADDEGQTVIRAARATLDGTDLREVTFLRFAPDGRPTRRIEAQSARLGDGFWHLRQPKVWPLGGEAIPERAAERPAFYTIETDLTRAQIRDSFGTPSSVPIWELPAFIDRLQAAGFSVRAHRVWLQTQLSLPMMLVAMILFGAGFTLRHTRQGRTGLMVLLALVMAFALYFVRNFAQIMGENGQLPVALAAWGPPLAAVLLALGLLLHLEDG